MKRSGIAVFSFVLLSVYAQAWSAGSSHQNLADGPQTGRVLIAQGGASATPASTPTPGAVPAAPRFDIQRFDVQGNTLLEPQAVEQAVAPFTGKSKDFGDVQRALESLQTRYRAKGYGAVQVILPEQELEGGVVVLKIIEPRLARVTVEGNQFFDEANIRRSLPALKEGETPNVVAIGQNSRLANENAAKRTSVLLRAGANEGDVDATVRVRDEKFWRAAVSLDNTGSPTTGMHRLGFGYQHSNLFDNDHTLTLLYQLDPAPLNEADDLKVLGIGYRLPLYSQNAYVDLLGGYSSIGSASGQVVQGVPFNLSGSGTVFGARYNYVLPRLASIADYEHRLSFGLDYKAFSNRVALTEVPDENLTPDVTVHPVSVGYTATKRMNGAELSFYGSVAHNIYPHGSDGSRENIMEAARGVGRPTYTIWRYGFNYMRAFASDVQFRANLTGQWSRDALVPGEQFGVGGWESIRGLHERESANDYGHRASLEVYSPDLGSKFGMSSGQLRLLAFYDWGRLKQNFVDAATCAPAACGFSASSFGLGVRMSLQKSLFLRLDYGQMIDPGATGERGDNRVHFGVAVGF